jgi:hypothetical protein
LLSVHVRDYPRIGGGYASGKFYGYIAGTIPQIRFMDLKASLFRAKWREIGVKYQRPAKAGE